ncbi:hypothetical protein [Halegenticoccus soli]|uniref:hypothetical protein n=1 Tax=Halegenticoccus soli TaxID=1985678 RepID=UPI001E5D28E3|nr:hypothetical protein [Halegenticoccus soli]
MATSTTEGDRDPAGGGDRGSSSDRGPRSPDERSHGPPGEGGGRNRKRAFLAVLPFLAIGLFDLVLLLFWGIEPLWAFAILPPILFCTVLAWIVFSTDFLEGRS